MKYERRPYMAPGAKYECVGTTIVPINVPVLDYPISRGRTFGVSWNVIIRCGSPLPSTTSTMSWAAS